MNTLKVEELRAGDSKDAKPEQYYFKDALAYKLQLLSRLLTANYLSRIVGTGIAPAQAYALGELWEEEALSQAELARRLEIGKATIGKTLSRLEDAGVIERKRDAKDRRAIMVRLTPEGRKLRDPLVGAGEEMEEMLKDVLGKDRVESISGVITVLIEMLRATED